MPATQRQMLDGAALCEPLAQGALDGLCGLYAAINAIRVVLAPERPLLRHDMRQLFEAGVEHLDKHGLLAASLVDGMEERVQFRLAKVLVKRAAQITGLAVSATRPVPPKGGYGRDWLIREIDVGLRHSAAIIACLGNTHDHYTVITGRSPTRYYLHDSFRLQWIDRASIGPVTTNGGHLHQVGRTGLVMVGLGTG